MWNRIELKEQGKTAFKANYWNCVVVALIALLIGGVIGGSGGANSASGANGEEISSAAVTVAVSLGVIGLILEILVINPLAVGCRYFFKENLWGRAELSMVGHGFRNGYGNTVGTMLLMDVFIFLWSLLFIIPGIIKAYSYRLVPYILADHPEMSPNDVITMSKEMMQGHKWNTFVLDLSFLGWGILSVITCGILGIFYVGPYYSSTDAALYEAIAGLDQE